MSLALLLRDPRSPRFRRWVWYLYDFGNSAYASVVVLAVYAAYFKQQVVGGAEGSRLWGLSVAIAMAVVGVSAPVLGAIADFSASKKRFLLAFTTVSCLFTAALFLVDKGNILTGMLFFILAEIGYRSAQVFYDALLPEIATPEEMGSVSGKGWALGSFGGIVILIIILPMIMMFKGTLTVRLSMVLAALFFALASIPLFLWLPERTKPQRLPAGESYFSIGFRRLWATIRRARHYREFIKFMLAFLVYNDGVMMALEFAAIIGAVLYGMDQQMLIVFMIIVQATNVVGAYVLGKLVDRIGCSRALVIAILLMVSAVTWLFFNETLRGYLVIGALTGFAMAGVQSVSRTMVGLVSPPGQSAEFFGLFSTAGRTSSFIGPAVYGWIAAEAAIYFRAQGMMENMAERLGIRMAVLSIGVFLLLGLLLLLTVNEKRARAVARAAREAAALDLGSEASEAIDSALAAPRTEATPARGHRRLMRPILKAGARLAFRVLADVRVEGWENLPARGPLILVGNHFHFADPALMLSIMPWYIDFIGGFHMPNAPQFITFIPKLWGIIPVKRGTATTDALRAAEKVLAGGNVLCVFPEGGSWAKVLRPARPGAAFLAVRTGAQLVPIGFDGVTEIFPSLRRGERTKVTVRIGKPFGPYENVGKGRERRQRLDEIGHEMMRHIAALIPPERHGYYSEDPAIRAAAAGTEVFPWDENPDL